MMFTKPIHLINIVAVSRNGIIGVDGKLPWRMKTELQEFVHSIKGFKLLMGRKTCESLPRKQNKEQNFVLTNDKSFSKEDYTTIHSIYDLEKFVREDEPVYIIGGGSLYEQVLALEGQPNVTITNQVTYVDKFITPGNDTVRFPLGVLEDSYCRTYLTRGIDDGVEWRKYLYYKN